MASVVQQFHHAATMTLGQQNKMYNAIISQQHSPNPSNCVIVTTTANNNNNIITKSVIQAKRPLAPAPERGSVLVTNNNNVTTQDLRCKRKIQFMPYGGQPQQPASVARRNARERNRVKQVNNGFATLRNYIPPSLAAALSPPSAASSSSSSSSGSSSRSQSKKLSKVETLRLAVEYIRSLQQMLDDNTSAVMVGGNPSDMDQNMLDNQRIYSGSPDSLGAQYTYPIFLPTPACSEASASPTPSHTSDGSLTTTSSYTTMNTLYHHQDNYENYDPKSPEDEELLDAIFSWQQE